MIGTALVRLAATAKKLKVSEITVKRRLADYRAAHPEVVVPEFKKRAPK